MTHFKQTLISSRHNVDIESFEVHGAQITPKCPVPWSVRKIRLRGGRQEGVSLIEFNNGHFTMRLIPTRGMGILDVVSGDLRLGWHSAVEEVVHPMFLNEANRGGTAWLEGFNELLVRCGLEWFGPPGEESTHLAAAEPPIGHRTLHGKIANIPASELELIVEQEPPYRIRLRGVVNEVMHYGPKLQITSEIITKPGDATFTVDDTITNLGGQTQEFGLLYHINFGRPILEPGTQLIAPAKRVTARDAVSLAAGVKQYMDYGPPETGSLEQAFLCTMHGDRRDQTRVMLQNSTADKAVSLAWSNKKLPCFTVWKGLHDERDGYVTGLEPGTNYPLARPTERDAGRVPKLAAGASHRATIKFGIHTSAAEVARTAKQIATISGSRRTRFDSESAE